jgi:hypothetical protein
MNILYYIQYIVYEIHGTNSEIPLITLTSLHAATISLDSSLKRADRNTYKMMTTITFHICNLIHLWPYCILPNNFYLLKDFLRLQTDMLTDGNAQVLKGEGAKVT